MENVKEVSAEARRAIADFRSKDGPAQGLMGDMRLTLSQAREATADLADNMEAMKHNFLLRGFFNRRGYFDLDAISPAEYRKGVLENGKRKAMRIWLADRVLFQAEPDGTETLTEDGRLRIDSAMATYLMHLPSNPIVIEGYATEGRTESGSAKPGSGLASSVPMCWGDTTCHRRTWVISPSETTRPAVPRATAGMGWRWRCSSIERRSSSPRSHACRRALRVCTRCDGHPAAVPASR